MEKHRLNFILSVLPKTTGICEQIDEEHEIQQIIAKALNEHGYRFVLADEDMMSEDAKRIANNLGKKNESEEEKDV